MRKFYTYFLSALVLAIAAAFSASAQKKEFKVEESSARNMPEWVNSVERDFLIATASGGDIEEAKAAVIENVKKQIAQSIATRIVSESSLTTSAYQSGSDFSKTQNLESSILSHIRIPERKRFQQDSESGVIHPFPHGKTAFYRRDFPCKGCRLLLGKEILPHLRQIRVFLRSKISVQRV